MADINVERKGPSIWPWIIGLLVLALLIWAIAEMVDTGEEEVAGREVAEQPVAAVPAPTPAPAEAPSAPVELETLLPLGTEDIGRIVRIRGDVVGQPTPEGFWLKTDANGDHVFFVRTPVQTRDGRTLNATDVRTDQDIDLEATIIEAQPQQVMTWMEQARLQEHGDYARWTVHQDMMLQSVQAGTMMPGAQQPGMQQPGAQQPGMQQPGTQQPGTQQPGAMQPGDTVTGRY